MSAFDPLAPGERRRLLNAERPRHALPLFAESQSRRLPLAAESRPIDRQLRPIYVVWELTLSCDLACRHCGSRAGSARPDELELDEALVLVAELAQLGVREVTLIGGEAYLYPGWTQVIEAIRAHGMHASLVTAGRGWTAQRAWSAKEAGLESVSFSIDGNQEVHDRLRGLNGAYRAAVNGMRESRNAGLPLSVNTQVNRLSLPHLPHVFELLRDMKAHGWQIQLTVPAGRAADEPEVLLQPYDLLELFPLLADLKQRASRAGIKCLAGNNLGYFGPYDHLLRDMSPCGHSTSCPSGRLGMGIEANGDIKGCPSLPTQDWVGGNIREQRLQDIWERSAPLRYTRDRNQADLWGFCRTCYYADDCRAGCTWMASSLFGRPGNNPYCHHRALELARQGLRERVRLRQRAPGSPFDHGHWELLIEPV